MTTPTSCKPVTIFIILGIFSFILLSCYVEKDPDVILENYILACEKVIKERQFRSLKDLISDAYQDTQNRSKKDLIAIARGYILRNKSISIFSHPLTVSQPDSANQISATVLVALSGKPIENLSMLPSINADIYLFELTLIREKEGWNLLSSSWRQAMLEDL